MIDRKEFNYTKEEELKQIKIFSAEWCSGCQALKTQLKAKEIPYVEVDLDTTEGMKEGALNGVRSLPTIILGDEAKLAGNGPDVVKKIVEYYNA